MTIDKYVKYKVDSSTFIARAKDLMSDTIWKEANQLLIQNECGILSVPPKFKNELGGLLVDYYETENTAKLFDFLYEKCLNRVSWETDENGEAIILSR